MSGAKFFRFVAIVFIIALVVYYVTMPRGNEIRLVGVIDGNTVIVSPQITGRLVKLDVDEGTYVKKGDLIGELDPKELQASLMAAKANVATLEASVQEAQHNYSWTEGQTGASLEVADAGVTTTTAQLEQAKVQLWRDQSDLTRMQDLYRKGEVSAQDREHAEAAVRMSQANVQALQQSVKAQQAAVAVATANRKQVDARKSALASTVAQLEQARATEAETATQLGYTNVYAPISGIVSVRVAKQGEVVDMGSPIVVLVDIDHLWARAQVPETYIDSIQFGQNLPVELLSGAVLHGNVFFKGVESDYATERDVSRTKRDIKTFAIKVAVPNPGRRLFLGMTATVLLPQQKTKSWLQRL
ncbi:MAG TPA: efflux RND transporter periplasmic adaptor subunit [Candidatus Acidoferrum sp.]|nr:efflux RND transporter periplasmic adaptor subunit [Candidatus Acidoferrum sp.]